MNSIFLLSGPHVLFLLRSLFTAFFVILNGYKTIFDDCCCIQQLVYNDYRFTLPHSNSFFFNVLHISERTILSSLKTGCNIFVAILL